MKSNVCLLLLVMLVAGLGPTAGNIEIQPVPQAVLSAVQDVGHAVIGVLSDMLDRVACERLTVDPEYAAIAAKYHFVGCRYMTRPKGRYLDPWTW